MLVRVLHDNPWFRANLGLGEGEVVEFPEGPALRDALARGRVELYIPEPEPDPVKPEPKAPKKPEKKS